MLFGFLFSKFAPEIPKDGWLRTPAFLHGIVYTTIFSSSALICYLVAPDWMWMYFIPDGTTPSPILIYVFIFLYYVPYIAGFFIGVHLRQSIPRAWMLGIGISFAFMVLITWALWERYTVVGTTAEFLSGSGKHLFLEKHSVSNILNFYPVVMIGYIIIIWRRFSKSAQNAESD